MKAWLIVAGSLVLAGVLLFVGVMSASGWNFFALNTPPYEEIVYEMSEDFSSISIQEDTAKISFVPYDGEVARVECFSQRKITHDVSVENGELKIAIVDGRAWYDHITLFSFASSSVKVYLPKTTYGALAVRSHTGDVIIPNDFAFERIEVEASTGDVACAASATEEISLKVGTGDVKVENVTCGKLTLSSTTGMIDVSGVACAGEVSMKASTGTGEVRDLTCGSLVSTANTGELLLTRVLVTDSLSVTRNTGDVTLDDCDAGTIVIRTNTGEVKGTLRTEKIVFAKTETGRVDVPHSTNGGRCEITTDTGDIKISILG